MFESVLNRQLAFQVVSENCLEVSDIALAIQWYNDQKKFRKNNLDKF